MVERVSGTLPYRRESVFFLLIIAGWVGWSAFQPALFGDYADPSWPSAFLEAFVLGLLGFRTWRTGSRGPLIAGLLLFTLAAAVRFLLATAGEIKWALPLFQSMLAAAAVARIGPPLFKRRQRISA